MPVLMMLTNPHPHTFLGLHRQCLFGGLRIGLYEPVRNFYVGKDHKGDPPLHLKIAAGLTTGAFGICVASPTDLVKVGSNRPQVNGSDFVIFLAVTLGFKLNVELGRICMLRFKEASRSYSQVVR
jgi:hypothetical protein